MRRAGRRPAPECRARGASDLMGTWPSPGYAGIGVRSDRTALEEDDAMGFLNGRVTFTRYRVGGRPPFPFGDEILGRLEATRSAGTAPADPTDGVSRGLGRAATTCST